MRIREAQHILTSQIWHISLMHYAGALRGYILVNWLVFGVVRPLNVAIRTETAASRRTNHRAPRKRPSVRLFISDTALAARLRRSDLCVIFCLPRMHKLRRCRLYVVVPSGLAVFWS